MDKWFGDPNEDLGPSARRALELARELADLVSGELSSITTDEQRRALKRLTKSLESSQASSAR